MLAAAKFHQSKSGCCLSANKLGVAYMDLNTYNHDEFLTSKAATIHCKERIRRIREQAIGRISRLLQSQYSEVSEELNHARDELTKLKLDMSAALAAKKEAEKELNDSDAKTSIYSSFIETIKEAIQDANEEQVLVELARIDAEREARDIETTRAAEAAHSAAAIDETRRKIGQLLNETRQSRELEKMLVVTTSDVNVLQNEIDLIKAMEKNIKKAAEFELEAANKELAFFNGLKFQLMASMDLVRGETVHIDDDFKKLNKHQKDTECAVQYLNTKLLKIKSKLELALACDERTTAVISNLSNALQQMQTNIEQAADETELLQKETTASKMEADESNLFIDITHARMQSAMEKLQAAKASEAITLSKLKIACERQIRARSPTSQQSTTTITISKFEYEYLRHRAKGAQEVADKKVAAAQAWIEAIEAGEKEISLKTEMVQMETIELRAVEETQLDDKCYNGEDNDSDLQLPVVKRRSFRGDKLLLRESGGVRVRRLSVSSARLSTVSSARRHSISRSPTTFPVKKRKKVVNNLVRFLKGQRIRIWD